jgi:hypothetical protein
MKRFKFCISVLLAVTFLAGAGFAAVTETVVLVEKVIPTYSISGVSLTPPTAPTDMAIIYGSATKTIRIRRITVSGLATTAGSMDVSLVKRTAQNVGGITVFPTTTGSALASTAYTMANVSYGTYGSQTAPNFSGTITWGSGTQSATMTIAGLTVGQLYRIVLTPTITSQAPVVTLSGATAFLPVPVLVTATVNQIFFVPTSTSVVFTFTNTAASTWTTASTATYAVAWPFYQSDTTNAAATASVFAYSAKPATLGTAQGIMNTKMLNFGVTGAAGVIDFVWPQNQLVAPLLHGVAEGIAINFNAEALPGAGGTVLSYGIEWEEF